MTQQNPSCHPERSEGSKHGTMIANGQSQHHEDEIDIIEYIKVVYKHRWMIMAIVLASMLFIGAASLRQPKMYEASATFFPLNMQSNIETKNIIIKPSLDIDDLIISILNSRKMADRIIEQLKLQNLWDVKAINNATKVSLGKNGIIKLSVQSKSPKISAKIANAYVDNLDYFNQQLDLGVQRNIVQVIDRAIVPEVRMPRGTIKKTFLAGMVSFMFAIFLAFFMEFIKNSNLKNRLKED